MSVLQLNETISANFKGVVVYMYLDYEAGTVSFVDEQGKPKEWLFIKRTEDYLGGWVRILGAMQDATKYANTRLREQREARENIKEEKIIDLAMSLYDIAENQTPTKEGS